MAIATVRRGSTVATQADAEIQACAVAAPDRELPMANERQLFYAKTPTDAFNGLESCVKPDDTTSRMRQVYEALKALGTDQTAFPIGTGVDHYRLFALTAGLGLWDEMDRELGPSRANLLLDYYVRGKVERELSIATGLNESTIVGHLDEALTYLYDHLPKRGEKFPNDPTKAIPEKLNLKVYFTLRDLQASRNIRRGRRVSESRDTGRRSA